MKHKYSIYTRLLLLVGILFLGSCQHKEQLQEESYSFEALKENLNNDQDFIDFRNHRSSFFESLRSQDYNLFAVSDQIGDFEQADFCALKNTYDGRLKAGVIHFSSFVCNDELLLEKVIAKFPVYRSITAEERMQLLSIATIVKPRAVDCLHSFQVEWALIDDFCDAVEANTDLECNRRRRQGMAIGNYNDCCNNGGSGCP